MVASRHRIYETELSGSSEPLHSHEVPAVVILVSGEAMAGGKRLDQPGSWAYIPAGEKHRVAAVRCCSTGRDRSSLTRIVADNLS